MHWLLVVIGGRSLMLWKSRQWKVNTRHLHLLTRLEQAVGSDSTLGEKELTHSRSQSHTRVQRSACKYLGLASI